MDKTFPSASLPLSPPTHLPSVLSYFASKLRIFYLGSLFKVVKMTGEKKDFRVSEQLRRLNFGDSDDNTDRLIIGLDFGTTYSGYVDILSCSFFQCHFKKN